MLKLVFHPVSTIINPYNYHSQCKSFSPVKKVRLPASDCKQEDKRYERPYRALLEIIESVGHYNLLTFFFFAIYWVIINEPVTKSIIPLINQFLSQFPQLNIGVQKASSSEKYLQSIGQLRGFSSSHPS